MLILSALGVMGAQADTYLVGGVNLSNITDSSTFYDNGKGYYWTWSTLSRQLESKYNANGKSYSFLGEWQSYTTGEGGAYSSSQIAGLTQDANTCWYNVSANLITYWQSTYGVFYTGSEALKTGYTYDKSYLSDFGGTQSLQIGKLLYDNWNNEGGYLEMAASWYFCGDTSWTSSGNLKTGAAPAGYFKEYFGDSSGGAYYPTVDYTFFGSRSGSGDLSASRMTLEHVTTAFSDAFGFTDDGEADAGKLGYLGISSSKGGHALTCYGYNTDENGVIKSLIVTNSDDLTYGTLELFVKVENGDLYLYSDAELTTRWIYSGVDWYVDELSFISTPDALKDMLSQYHDTDNGLVWSGELNSWSSTYATQGSAEEMPTADTGWDVYAASGSVGGYFHAFYDANRAVEFSDYAGSHQNISVAGAVTSGTMQLSADTYDYTFTASGSGSSITAKNIYKSGDATVEFSGITVTAQGYANVSGGTLKMTDGAWLTAGLVQVQSHGTLYLDNAGLTSMTGSMTVGSKGTLEIGTGGAKIYSTLTLQDGANLSFHLRGSNTSTAALTLSGQLTIDGLCSFLFNEGELTDNTTYSLIYFTNGWNYSEQLANISLGTGSLSYSGNVLYYTYLQSSELTWDSLSSGTWSSTEWDGTTVDTASANLTFAADATISINGAVSPGKMSINAGKSITLLAGEGAQLTGTRAVTLAENSTLHTQVALSGRSISLASGATLRYDVAGENKISDIDLAAGSSLQLAARTTDTNTQHTISSANRMEGNISIGSGNDLTLELNESKELTGTVSSAAGTRLTFANSSASQAITYTLTNGTAALNGTVAVGREGDKQGTTLSTNGASSTAFELASKGTLHLTGGSESTPAVFTGSVAGNGTLLVDKDATVTIAVSGNQTQLSSSTTLLVQGNATIGANGNWVSDYSDGTSSGLSTTLTDKVAVDGGTLTAWLDCTVSDSPLSIQNLALSNGGEFTLKNTFSKMEYGTTIRASIGTLTVGEGGGSFGINSDFRGRGYSRPNARVEIGALKGAGDLTLYGHSVYDAKTQITSVADASAFTGNITVKSEVDSSININSLHITTLEFTENTSMSGSITVNGERVSRYYTTVNNCRLQDFMHRAMLGLDADVSIGGLNGNDGAYLYAGALNAADITASIICYTNLGLAYANEEAEAANVAAAINRADHTLTIKTGGTHDFAGTVMEGVSITKQGSGSQTFSGNTARFNGSVDVQEGRLIFTSTSGLTVEDLEVSAGAVLSTRGTLSATGDVSFTAASLAALYRAATLSTEDVRLSGSATVDSHLDLSVATSLTMGTQVSLQQHSLTLGDTVLPLELTLGGLNLTQGSVFDLVLFTDVSSLILSDSEYTSGTWDAADYFESAYITDSTQMVLEDGTLSLVSLAMVPEPATATLSLLALAALAARRRRRG